MWWSTVDRKTCVTVCFTDSDYKSLRNRSPFFYSRPDRVCLLAKYRIWKAMKREKLLAKLPHFHDLRGVCIKLSKWLLVCDKQRTRRLKVPAICNELLNDIKTLTAPADPLKLRSVWCSNRCSNVRQLITTFEILEASGTTKEKSIQKWPTFIADIAMSSFSGTRISAFKICSRCFIE